MSTEASCLKLQLDSAFLLLRSLAIRAPTLEVGPITSWLLEGIELPTELEWATVKDSMPTVPVILDSDYHPIGVLIDPTSYPFGLVLTPKHTVLRAIDWVEVEDKGHLLLDWRKWREVALAIEYPLAY